jgi:putative MATE family efflux protein
MRLKARKNYYFELLRLAIPIVLQGLVSFSLSLANNVMVRSLGNTAVSSVYMANQVQLLLTFILTAVEGTLLVAVSRSLGANDTDGARRRASLGVMLSLLVSLLFFIPSFFFPRSVVSLFTDKSDFIRSGAEYLRTLSVSFIPFSLSQALSAAMRASKKAKIGFFASVIALVVNIALNFALIYGELGVVGAGISSAVARFAELAFLFAAVFIFDKKLSLRPIDFFRFNKASAREFIKLGYPLILSQLVWGVNSFFSTALIGRLDGVGIVAAVSCASALYNLSYVATNGISGALGIVCARYLGAGRGEELREHINATQLLFVFLGVLTALVMQGLRLPFISLFKLEKAAAYHATAFIGILSALSVATAYQSSTLSGFIRSVGDTKFIMKTEAFSVFCIIIPLSLLAWGIGAHAWIIFFVLKCDQLVKCPIAFFKLKSLKSKLKFTNNA